MKLRIMLFMLVLSIWLVSCNADCNLQAGSVGLGSGSYCEVGNGQ